MGCKNVMVYIETAEGKPVNASLEMITGAKTIAEKVTAVVIGAADAAKEAINYGADEAITVAGVEGDESVVAAFAEVVKKYAPEMIFVGATANGKIMGARIAAALKAGCVTDVIAVKEADGKVVLSSPMYSGTVISESVVEGTAVAIVRGGVFKKAEPAEKDGNIIAETVEIPAAKTKVVDTVQEISDSVTLEEADVIVAGGRGMGSVENFELVKELASLMGGVVGATRPVIDEGWISRAHQVGQSGKIVAPKLYIAAGISGAAQHVSGITGSDFIVAINKDESAPIFDVADYGVVGDLNKIVPMLTEKIKEAKAAAKNN